jgi:hypothetical protein
MERKRLLAISIIILISASCLIGVLVFLQMNPTTLTLTELSQVDTGTGAVDVEVVGSIAYVIDQEAGLVIVNITDPSNPDVLSTYTDGGQPSKLDIAEGYAFIADRTEGLEIIDVSNLTNPTEIGAYEGSGEIYDVELVGNIAYVADWNNGLVILNVTDPSAPTFISRYSIIGACIFVKVESELAYIIDHRSASSGLMILNVTDSLHPSLEDSLTIAGVDFWNPYVSEQFVYLGNHGTDGGECRILDVRNPSEILEASSFDAEGMVFGIYVDDDRAYLGDSQKGLVILNVADPYNPVQIGNYYFDGLGDNLVTLGNLVYIADRFFGLRIIKLG